MVLRLGAGWACVECKTVERGAFELWLTILAIGGVYHFANEYDKPRANATLLAADVRKSRGTLDRSIERVVKKLESDDNPPPPSDKY